MLQAVRRAAAALQRSLPLVTEIGRNSSLTAQAPLYEHIQGFATSSQALNVTTARQVPEQEIAAIRQRVFGTHIGNGLPSGRKILRKKLVGEKIAAYYDHARPIKDPLIVDLNAEKYANAVTIQTYSF